MPRHILVVEDEEHLAKGVCFNLEQEGYVVDIASDGQQAMDWLDREENHCDLIILDIMLPGMSGYEICQKVRKNGSGVPILMLSARNLSEDRARGFDVGADQYLTKPFELDELLSRVKNLLNRFGHGASPAITTPTDASNSVNIGGLRVDFDSYEVRGKTVAQRLTALEIKLLRYFIQNKGRVIPRYELLEEVWELSGDVNTRAPDQFIRRLRKLFEPDPSNPKHFLTVRDAGYRFVMEAGEES